ncbi:L-alanine exporter AlaE [Oceanicola sp. D3]|uniref:L-alanine exporter AlaE n=1 Tax=Oceanicola sp. D3 TaxID=2587163 RepID=UPI00112348BF|nr:L-alanine exporter AlaE [Oceanicola sp. D3]QDC11164.1 L-alanine exporter AlaE [Oceanicola sp. D3]
MRLFLVDTLTAVLFFTTVAALSELLIAGMEPSAVLFTRLVMIPVMVATGRPYGWWRDMLFRRFAPRRARARTALDITAFISFQAPVYALTLLAAGATLAQTTAAVGSALVLMVLLSRPYGLLLDWSRRMAGVTPA